jgi:hypothetical protein
MKTNTKNPTNPPDSGERKKKATRKVTNWRYRQKKHGMELIFAFDSNNGLVTDHYRVEIESQRVTLVTLDGSEPDKVYDYPGEPCHALKLAGLALLNAAERGLD